MYLKFLWSLLCHKLFVFVECCRLGIPWLGVVHDWSKFLPSEFIPYGKHFGVGSPVDRPHDISMDYAWLHHQHFNKHHPQYWISKTNGKPDVVLPMPDRYRREMLADWRGAGRAYGNPDTKAWYEKNKDNIILHPETRAWVESELLSLFRLTPVAGDGADAAPEL